MRMQLPASFRVCLHLQCLSLWFFGTVVFFYISSHVIKWLLISCPKRVSDDRFNSFLCGRTQWHSLSLLRLFQTSLEDDLRATCDRLLPQAKVFRRGLAAQLTRLWKGWKWLTGNNWRVQIYLTSHQLDLISCKHTLSQQTWRRTRSLFQVADQRLHETTCWNTCVQLKGGRFLCLNVF